MALFEYNDPAFAGMKADSGDDRVETFACGSDPVGFGLVLTSADRKKVAAGGTDDVVGISLHSHVISPDGYKECDAVSVMTRGHVWAKVGGLGTATNGEQVCFDETDGTVTDADSSTYPNVPNAVFRSSDIKLKDTTKIALVELHNPFAQ